MKSQHRFVGSKFACFGASVVTRAEAFLGCLGSVRNIARTCTCQFIQTHIVASEVMCQ